MFMEPLLTREIDGLPLRVFSSPRFVRYGRPDLPWHSADDLRKVLRLGDELSTLFRNKMKSDWDEIVTVGTEAGITTIAPHFMAEGMLDFMRYRPRMLPAVDRKRIAAQLRRAVTEALVPMLPGARLQERLLFGIAAQQDMHAALAAP